MTMEQRAVCVKKNNCSGWIQFHYGPLSALFSPHVRSTESDFKRK